MGQIENKTTELAPVITIEPRSIDHFRIENGKLYFGPDFGDWFMAETTSMPIVRVEVFKDGLVIHTKETKELWHINGDCTFPFKFVGTIK